MIPTREQIDMHFRGAYMSNWTEAIVDWLRAMRDEIDRLAAELAALKPSDTDAKLRDLRAKLVGHGYLDLDLPMRILDKMLAQPAPVEKPAAAVPDHFPDAGKMVPDDTRELVAQLAELLSVTSYQAGVIDKANAIAAKLRGGA